MVREEDIQTPRADVVFGIPLRIAPPPPPRPSYKLRKCAKRGCRTLLPSDLKWCGLHKPPPNYTPWYWFC